MADRLFVAYKTPLHRFVEIAIIAVGAIGPGLLWQHYLPTISPSYLIIALLVLGFAMIPRLGSQLAARRGATMMSVSERNRRYLTELGPIRAEGSRFAAFALVRPQQTRRSPSRSRRRG